MKIRRARINRRKRALEVDTSKGTLCLPFSRLPLRPSAGDRIETVYVDSELAHECVTYVFASGKEDSVHLDAFLEYNRDPAYLRDLALHRLTLDAQDLLKRSDLSKHELIRRLKTSPSQLYRLLDPANYKKSIDEMLRLLAVFGYRVEMKVLKVAA